MLQRTHRAQPAADFLFGGLQVVGCLQIEPVLRCLPEGPAEQQGQLRRDGTRALNDVGNPHGRNSDGAREFGLGRAQLFERFLEKLPRMDRGQTVLDGHVASSSCQRGCFHSLPPKGKKCPPRRRGKQAPRAARTHRRAVSSASSIAPTASAITPVASQPRFLRRRLTVKRPMISGRTAISIITAMIGTEITPLITALQMSALTGSIAVKLSATPIVVAAMRMP